MKYLLLHQTSEKLVREYLRAFASSSSCSSCSSSVFIKFFKTFIQELPPDLSRTLFLQFLLFLRYPSYTPLVILSFHPPFSLQSLAYILSCLRLLLHPSNKITRAKLLNNPPPAILVHRRGPIFLLPLTLYQPYPLQSPLVFLCRKIWQEPNKQQQ